jgi:predicted RNase H-like HicB family nuclease
MQDPTVSDQPRYSMVIQWSDEDQAYIVSFPE